MPEAAEPRRRWVRLALIAVLLTVIIVVIRGLLGDIDGEKVRTAVARLALWQVAALVAGLLVRQYLSALPLALFIPGCSPVRAMQNDQAAILMTTVAPPPSDVVLRLAMFNSWGISASAGLVGTVMSTAAFYVVRFGAPLLGIALMLALGTFHLAEFVPAVISGLVSAGLLAVLWVAFRREAFAVGLARRLAHVVARVRSGVDAPGWTAWAADFRGRVVDRVPWALPRSVLALVAMLVVDATLVLISLRFVGVTAAEVPAIEVLVAFLVAYPLTLFPFSGLGIMDAVVVAALLAIEAGADEAEVVAGLVIWRAVTIAGPLVLGLLSVGLWKLLLVRAR